MNLVNDVLAMPPEATVESNYWTILDAIHAHSPNAIVYVARPWRRSYNTEADTLAGYISTVVAGRSFARLGPDERTWLKGADDGATYTLDGIHYNPAGEAENARQWQIVLSQ